MKYVYVDPNYNIKQITNSNSSILQGIYNLKIENGNVDQHSRISKVDKNDDKSIQQTLPANETRVALLANLFVSEGKPGKVS